MEFDFTTAQTVTGFTLAQVVAEMQKPLPAAAYKPVPGATDLTDIDPAYLTEVATKVFGPIGLGWWYDFRPGDLAISAEARTAKSGREYTVFTASLHKLSVQYRLIDVAEADDAHGSIGHRVGAEPARKGSRIFFQFGGRGPEVTGEIEDQLLLILGRARSGECTPELAVERVQCFERLHFFADPSFQELNPLGLA